MIISKKTMTSWKTIYEHGDIERIHDKSVEWGTPVSAKTIGDAIRKRRASETTIEVIGRFYKEKKQNQELLMQKVTIENE